MTATKKQKPAKIKLAKQSKTKASGTTKAKPAKKNTVKPNTKSLATPAMRPSSLARNPLAPKPKSVGNSPKSTAKKSKSSTDSPSKEKPSSVIKSGGSKLVQKPPKTPVAKLASKKYPGLSVGANKSASKKNVQSAAANRVDGHKVKIAPSKGPSRVDTSKSIKADKSLAAVKNDSAKNVVESKEKKTAVVAAKNVSPVNRPEPVPPPSNTNPAIIAKIRIAQAEKELRKDLAQPAPKSSLTPITTVPPIAKGKDRLILMVRDPYWIHAHWDIMRHSVDRAKAALAEKWHTVKPILRLLKLDDSGTTNNAEVIYSDIEIHGGVRNWYIDVDSPPSRFRMLMGYLCANGRFYELARSNTVVTPALGGKEATDDHWADIATDAEHIYSMSGGYGDDTQTGDLTEVFEESLKRTMDVDVLSQFGSGAEGSLKRHKQFHFDVNAELVVFGSTHPEAHVSVGTEPVKVRSDGSFSIRMPLPDRRQVLPATAKSRDGVDSQTVVLAVERNTKVMEPVTSDADDL